MKADTLRDLRRAKAKVNRKRRAGQLTPDGAFKIKQRIALAETLLGKEPRKGRG